MSKRLANWSIFASTPASICSTRLMFTYKVVDAIDDVAKETGKTVPQIALNWLLQRPTVSTIIVGARQ